MFYKTMSLPKMTYNSSHMSCKCLKKTSKSGKHDLKIVASSSTSSVPKVALHFGNIPAGDVNIPQNLESYQRWPKLNDDIDKMH